MSFINSKVISILFQSVTHIIPQTSPLNITIFRRGNKNEDKELICIIISITFH